MWSKTKNAATHSFEVLRTAGKAFGSDRVNRMSAAVAYRTMFALAPLLLVAVFVLGLVIGGSEAARDQILDSISEVAGVTVATAIDTFLGSARTSGNTAGIVGFGLLLWTGSSLFLELQNDLNDIFGVPYESTSGWLETIKKRIIGFFWALGVGLILVAVWALNSLWQLLGNLFPASFLPIHRVIAILAPVVSLVLLPFVFALIFQTLTQVKVRWRSVWWGAFFTTVAFLLTAYGAAIYFRTTSANAAVAAAAVFVLLLLAYILSAVFLFGAEVTKELDRRAAQRSAVPVPDPVMPGAVVAGPEQPLPVAALVAFLGGLLVGWRRKG